MEFNPSRFSLARRRRGLSQRAAAQLIGCTDRTVRRWERGEKAPDPSHLEVVSQKLGFPEEFFFRPDVEPLPVGAVSFRALTKARAADRERAVAAGSLALELSDWLDKNFDLPAVDVPDLRHHRDDPEAAAMALRTRWGLGDKPIKNMIALLEFKGVRVFSLAEECYEIDAFSFWQGERPFIFLNTLKSSERSRFDAAHELAHLVLHRHGTTPDRVEEREANAFAGAFLMPESSITAFAPRIVTLPRLVQAKHHWNVAVSALAHRLHGLSIISDWQYRSLCRDIQKAGFRTSEPESAPREMSQVFDKVFSALRAEGIGKAALAERLGWPLDELNSLVFGLILSPIQGNGQASSSASSDMRGKLRLLK